MDKNEYHYNSIERECCKYVKKCIDYIVSLGMSQKALADFLGVSPVAVCQWKYGKKIPSTIHYIALNSLYIFLKGEGGVFKDE